MIDGFLGVTDHPDLTIRTIINSLHESKQGADSLSRSYRTMSNIDLFC